MFSPAYLYTGKAGKRYKIYDSFCAVLVFLTGACAICSHLLYCICCLTGMWMTEKRTNWKELGDS